jgi:transposase-like protein
MVRQLVKVTCPFCGSEKVSKNGHNRAGKQVYNGNNSECTRHNFVAYYSYKAYEPEIRKHVLQIAVECTGTRATGRILGISKDMVTAILKKTKAGCIK